MKRIKEKRRNIRIEVNKQCRSNEGEDGIEEYISNISNVGFKLHSQIIFKPGDIVGITLLDEINKYGNHLYLIGNVIRIISQKDNIITYGVQILDNIDVQE